jgi:hypothetical protein
VENEEAKQREIDRLRSRVAELEKTLEAETKRANAIWAYLFCVRTEDWRNRARLEPNPWLLYGTGIGTTSGPSEKGEHRG